MCASFWSAGTAKDKKADENGERPLATQSRRMSVWGGCSMDDGLDGADLDEDEGRPDKSFSDEQLWLEVDSYIQRFEEAWQKGARPNIDDFLPSGDRRPCAAPS